MSQAEFTQMAEKALQDAVQLARDRSHGMLTTLHVAVAAFTDPNGLACRAAAKLGANPSAIHRQLADKLNTLPTQSPAPPKPSPTADFQKLMNSAEQTRIKLGDSLVALDHFLLSFNAASGDVDKILTAHQLSAAQIERAVMELRGNKKITSKFQEANYEALSKYAVDLCERAEQGKLDPVIGRDEELRSLIMILARRTKSNALLIAGAGVGKTAIVEGFAGRIVSGDVPEQLRGVRVFSLDMAALVAGASYRGEFEERLKAVLSEVEQHTDSIILFIDEIHLVLGAGKTDGAMDAANIMKPALARGTLKCIGATTLDEYAKYIEKDTAFMRRFQTIHVNEPSVADAVSILRGLKQKYEAHHRVQIADGALVAAATLAKRYITGRHLPDSCIDLVDSACANLRVQIDSRPEAIDKLERAKLQLEIEKASLEREKADNKKSAERLKAVQAQLDNISEELKPLLARYEAERAQNNELSELQVRLEEKRNKLERAKRTGEMQVAADLLGFVIPDLEASIAAKKQQIELNKKTQMLKAVVTEEEIAQVVSKWTGVPVSKLTQSERERLLHLADRLRVRVKGQDEALARVSEAILRSRAGLSRSNRPIGSFLMIGPTGVGKTEIARALAAELFDDEKMMLRIDCSELMEQHSVARLIGAPAGYVGHDDPNSAMLTEPVRRRSHQVVLFDEVEKAHPNVLNVLLQLLDDGRLSDSKGHVVDFSNTVVFLTSNLGAMHLVGPAAQAKSQDQLRELVMGEVRKFFRPELINRLDDILVFKNLSQATLRLIAKQAIEDVNKRLAERHTVLTLTDAAVDYILQEAYDPDLGARPLKRWVERHVVTDLSRMILSGTLPEGSDVTADRLATTAAASASGAAGGDGKSLAYTVRRNRNAPPQSPPSPVSP